MRLLWSLNYVGQNMLNGMYKITREAQIKMVTRKILAEDWRQNNIRSKYVEINLMLERLGIYRNKLR